MRYAWGCEVRPFVQRLTAFGSFIAIAAMSLLPAPWKGRFATRGPLHSLEHILAFCALYLSISGAIAKATGAFIPRRQSQSSRLDCCSKPCKPASIQFPSNPPTSFTTRSVSPWAYSPDSPTGSAPPVSLIHPPECLSRPRRYSPRASLRLPGSHSPGSNPRALRLDRNHSQSLPPPP